MTKSFEVKDVEGLDVKAALSFEFKGWTISASTIMRPSSVAVWFEDGDMTMFETVEDAVDYVTENNKSADDFHNSFL